jgi:hypothetical protein
VDALPRTGCGSFPCFGRKKKRFAVFLHPRADSKFGITVTRSHVNVVYTVFK